MRRWPWSNTQLKRLSDHVRKGTQPEASLPPYNDVMAYYDDLAAQVQQEIRQLDLTPLLGDVPIEVTSRAKTIDTLRQKLVMYPDSHIHTVQDVAGVRFEAEMSMEQQDGVVAAIAGLYGASEGDIKDYRSANHSGYRAVHIWLRLPSKVEVQVRTHLQGLWANLYESAADVLGREIRYDQLPDGKQERAIVVGMQEISTQQIVRMETTRNIRDHIALAVDEGRMDVSLTPVRAGSVNAASSGEDKLSILRKEYMSQELHLRQELTTLKEMFDDMIALRKD